MHELLHIAILSSTITGAAALAVFFLWPLFSDVALAGSTKALLLGLAGLAVVLFLLEWQVVH